MNPEGLKELRARAEKAVGSHHGGAFVAGEDLLALLDHVERGTVVSKGVLEKDGSIDVGWFRIELPDGGTIYVGSCGHCHSPWVQSTEPESGTKWEPYVVEEVDPNV